MKNRKILLSLLVPTIFAGSSSLLAAEGGGDCGAFRAGSLNEIAALSEADAIAACQQSLGSGQVSLGATYTLYTSEYPDTTLDATPDGWEVGTKFTSSTRATVIGFRFWKAVGESGTNTVKLWSNGGTQLTSENFPNGSPGWVDVAASPTVHIIRNAVYVVSVNTNVKQVKRAGAYVYDGAISSGALYSDTGYYGQPIHSKPGSSSASYFFVDVEIEERDFPIPGDPAGPPYFADPKVDRIQANLRYQGQEIVLVRVCNKGDGPAEPSSLHFRHWTESGSDRGGRMLAESTHPTAALAPGACQDLAIPVETVSGACNQLSATLYGSVTADGVRVVGRERALSYCK